MIPIYLQRILDLVDRTGDRCIMVNPETEDAHVVMSLTDYEVLMDVAAHSTWSMEDEDWGEDGLETDEYEAMDVSQANEAIAQWKEEDAEEALGAIEDDSGEGFTPIADFVENFAKLKQNQADSEHAAVEVEEKEEERFYIEPVE